MNDLQLTKRIRDALAHDGRLSETAVGVSARNGVVTLRGSVQTHRRKLDAQTIAASIDGCRDVYNELTVEPPGQHSDEEVTDFVRKALESDADVHSETILVMVSRGIVQLSGNVTTPAERAIAEDVALAARGVREVKNLLLVSRDGRIEDEALMDRIREALSHTRGLRDTNVHVAVTGETAILTGAVQELWQKQTAEQVVRRFVASDVRNEIQINGC